MYAAAVFDMDGTVLDTIDDLQLSLNHTLQAHGFPPYSLAEVRSMVGNGTHRLLELALPDDVAPETFEAVLEDYKDYYGEHCNDHTSPYPGVTALLRRLHAAGVRLAVVSNKPDFAVRDLADLHFPGLFDVALGQRDDIPRKPDRAMVDLALEAVGVTGDEACYVGDSEVDVYTAANAGLDALIVTWGFRDPAFLAEKGARVLLSTPAQLEAAIMAGPSSR